MRRFTEKFLMPYFAASGYTRLCEIGSQGGSNIDNLLRLPSVAVTVVDPCVDSDLESKYAGNPRMRVCKGLSLEMLPTLEGQYDSIMIDADHNWYSVYHELTLIHSRKLLAAQGTMFLHDVCWPYARRDMYYDPATVPEEHRQPSAKMGIVRGFSRLSDNPAVGKNTSLWNATHEGGSRNGVLTAIEDFLRDHPGAYDFFRIQREWGLGVLVHRGQRPAGLRALRSKARVYNLFGPFRAAASCVANRLKYRTGFR